MTGVPHDGMEAEYANGRELINSSTCNMLKGKADDMSTVVSEQAAKSWAEAKHLPMRAGEMAISAPPRAGAREPKHWTTQDAPHQPRGGPDREQGRGSITPHLQKTGTRC